MEKVREIKEKGIEIFFLVDWVQLIIFYNLTILTYLS